MYVYHVPAWYPQKSDEAIRSMKLELGLLYAMIWILGTEPESSARATRAFNL